MGTGSGVYTKEFSKFKRTTKVTLSKGNSAKKTIIRKVNTLTFRVPQRDSSERCANNNVTEVCLQQHFRGSILIHLTDDHILT